MNRYRAPGVGVSSKASSSTLCQKCLKRDNFECKAGSQERPYVSRPSRTQQLLNPKLLPKLTNDAPDEVVKKKGLADEILAQKERERGRKRDRNEDAVDFTSQPKRRRSVSSASSDSVSTISTDQSRSPSPIQRKQPDRSSREEQRSTSASKRRRASTSSVDSYVSGGEDTKMTHGDPDSRSTRRKYGESSPGTRGRRSDRSRSYERRRRYSSADSRSLDHIARGRRSLQADTPDDEVMKMALDKRRQRSRSQSSAESSYLSDTARPQSHNQWPSRPKSNEAGQRYSPEEHYRKEQSTSKGGDRRGRFQGDDNRRSQARSAPRERSLSPYSRRLALTQAMNIG